MQFIYNRTTSGDYLHLSKLMNMTVMSSEPMEVIIIDIGYYSSPSGRLLLVWCASIYMYLI